ncbi:plasma membrane fusion protein prm1 [Mortierella polycephala]|uniref:Plasma membrane fusion protein PRM1 n=1 Tax=Mortierella polycephala TaxID=41804 RepID=A0A9P6Q5W7_9FUNG|nr:plasma membrane fusion protein prm1 [Mortierella polycephala]
MNTEEHISTERAHARHINLTGPVSPLRIHQEQPSRNIFTIQPFLGLRAKLSQGFACYSVVFLVISAYRLFCTRNAIETFASTAKETVASDCYTLEKTVSTLGVLPYFAAQGVNHGLVLALNSAVNQIGYGLEAVLSGLLATLDLVVGLLTGTWRCFLTNLADSDVPLLSEIGDGGVQAINEMDKALIILLATPFNELGALIQQKMTNHRIGLPVSASLLQPQKVKICDKMLSLDAVDTLTDDLRKYVLYAALILLALAVAAALCNMATISYHHKRWKRSVVRIMDLLRTETQVSLVETRQPHTDINNADTQPNEIEVRDEKLLASRISFMTRQPVLYRILDTSSRQLFPENENRRNLYIWLMLYIFQPQAVVCLLIGILGLILIYSQVALIGYFRMRHHPVLATALQGLTDTALDYVNSTMYGASRTFATETNIAIASMETDLNASVFGAIVHAASELGSTLAVVQTSLIEGVRAVFGNGLFGKLILAVLQCLLFNKLSVIENGLSWIESNAYVSLPRVSEDVLVMEQAELNRLVMASVAGTVNPTVPPSSSPIVLEKESAYVKDKLRRVGDVIDRVLVKYEQQLLEELPVYYGLMGVWCAVLAMGLVGAGVILVRQSTIAREI